MGTQQHTPCELYDGRGDLRHKPLRRSDSERVPSGPLRGTRLPAHGPISSRVSRVGPGRGDAGSRGQRGERVNVVNLISPQYISTTTTHNLGEVHNVHDVHSGTTNTLGENELRGVNIEAQWCLMFTDVHGPGGAT